MPWTERRYPASMRYLPNAVRQKAIEIANALLADGYDEGQAIRFAIAAAKKWAAHRGWLVAANEPPGGAAARAARQGPRARQPPSARQPSEAPRRDQG